MPVRATGVAVLSAAAIAGLAVVAAIRIGRGDPIVAGPVRAAPMLGRPGSPALGSISGSGRFAARVGRARRCLRAQIRAGATTSADLLAACLAAGASPLEAVEAASTVLDGPVADRLAQAARRVRAGEPAERCWRELGVVPDLEGIARILARAAVSGTRASGPMATEAGRLRLRRAAESDRALARLGVWAVAPLSLCFLPAFICLGIVPVAIGLGSGLAG